MTYFALVKQREGTVVESGARQAVLITGGTKRLGFEYARKSLSMGFDVVLQYRSDPGDVERWLSGNPALCARVWLVQADLRESAERLPAAAREHCRGLVGLVNNAAVFDKGDLSDPAGFEGALAVNALAPLRLCAAFRAEVGRGWIVNVTDAHIRGDNLAFQNYRMSKRFLRDITEQLALAYSPLIRVNAIAPGAMLPSAHTSRAAFSRLAHSIPLRRTGSVEALLRAYEYLVESDYVTGQTMYVDGGWHLT
jgi:NAD(P)-dependent dehydrogenase (short-subunit alcohol dehydrogenase family)